MSVRWFRIRRAFGRLTCLLRDHVPETHRELTGGDRIVEITRCPRCRTLLNIEPLGI